MAILAPKEDDKLSLMSLVALIVGTMIGGGAFALPQNLAVHSSAGGILLGWLITGVGMLALALVFRNLSKVKPELKDGIYSYPRDGFGLYAGFNSAWGYWVSAWLGNVSYAVLLFSALGYFFPVFGDGNTLYAIIGGSIFLWIFHFLILKGVKQAVFINMIATISKLVPIVLFIVLVTLFFNIKKFAFNFWGMHLGSVFEQVKSTMLITVWVFIGIEGAIVESSRARRGSDVGKAAIVGLAITLLLYVLISLLSFGVVSQNVLAQAKNPSMAFVLQQVVGTWGAIITNLGLIISLFGAWLGWTLLCVQLPYDAAGDGSMPKLFAKQNKNKSPANALWLSNGLIQVFLIIVFFSHSTYLTLLKLSTSCILVPYLLCALYALKMGGSIGQYSIAVIAVVYAGWLLYAAGLHFLFLSFILYAAGIIFYFWARKEKKQPLFVKLEWVLSGLILLLAMVAVIKLL